METNPSAPSASLPKAMAPSTGSDQAWIVARGVAGAALGGFSGYFVFYFLWRQGFYGIMIPGVLLGLGAGTCARGRSQVLGVVCLVFALALTVYTEWHVLYSKNHTFQFFLANMHTLPKVKLVMMGLGVLAGYWFGQGR